MLMEEDETDKRVICNHKKKTRKVSFCEKNNKIYRILLLMSHLLLTFANHIGKYIVNVCQWQRQTNISDEI